VEAEGAQGIRSTLPRLLCIALVALTLVLLLRYRRPRVALLAAVPLALSVLVFVGLHGALGLAITPFSLGALPLLIGVGIDDHLFVLDRYLEGGRPGSLGDTLAGAGRAVGVTTLTTVAAFGLLSFSSFDPLASFGLAVVMALGLAFCSSVVVMPVLLALWLPGEEGTC